MKNFNIIHFQGFHLEETRQVYAKITLMENNKEITVKKISRCKQKNMLNFSKEVTFKLKRKLIENISIKIQLKNYTGFGHRGKLTLFQRNCN